MKPISLALLFVLLISACLALSAVKHNQMTFYVSPVGNDRWTGTLPVPNRGKTDGPLLTLERAQAATREFRLLNPSLIVRVAIRAGSYTLGKTLRFDKVDSGTAGNPALWDAYKGESVHVDGGKHIRGFQHVADLKVLDRIQPEFRDKILVADLKREGITDFGILPYRMNLFFNGRRMTVARYPNKGWLRIADVPQFGDSLINPGDVKVIKDGHPGGRHFGRFVYEGERPTRWSDKNDIWMHGYWAWDWRDDYQKVQRIDRTLHEIFPAAPFHHYGYEKGQRYLFLNILEEIDTPGEWCLDPGAGLLYFWPPSPIGEGNEVIVSMLKDPMILLENTSHIRFEHIRFECSRACAVKIVGGVDNIVGGCTIRNIDNDTCIVVDGGERNGVVSCDIHDAGGTGIKISGGDRKTLTPAGNFARNNHIFRYGEIVQAFSGAIWMNGVGNSLSHNRIHDAPFSGIQFYGNDHSIEFNELYDLAHESGDVGGVNTGASYAEQGTVIRYNFFHDTHGYGEGGFRAVYLDLPGSGMKIIGNVFSNVDIGVFFNSGRDNLIQNNVFVNCHPSVNIYTWPHKQYFHKGGPYKIVEKLEDIRYTSPPYSTRYPRLPRYLDSADLGMPYGNIVVNNISYAGTWLDLSETVDFNHVRVERNLVADSMLLVVTRKWTPDYDPYHIGYAAVYPSADSGMRAILTKLGNRVIRGDPGFVDAERGNFQLKDSSPAFGMGFVRIPMEKIGLQPDRFRKRIDPAGRSR